MPALPELLDSRIVSVAALGALLLLSVAILLLVLPLLQHRTMGAGQRRQENAYLDGLVAYMDKLHSQSAFDRRFFVERYFRVTSSSYEPRAFFLARHRSAMRTAPASVGGEQERSQAGYYSSDLLREAARRRQPIIVLGEPGSGKTVSVRQLAREVAHRARRSLGDARPIPVFASLHEYTDIQADGTPASFYEFLSEMLHNRERGSALPSHHLRQNFDAYLDAGRFLFILDSLDEMPPASFSERCASIEAFVRRHVNCLFVITCRSHDFAAQIEGVEAHIDKLRPREIRRFVVKRRTLLRSWSPRKLHALITSRNFALNSLVDNPFYLNLILYYLALTESLPDNLGELFRVICGDWARREIGKEVARGKLPKGGLDREASEVDGRADQLLKLLSAIAFRISNSAGFGTNMLLSALQDDRDSTEVEAALGVAHDGGLLEVNKEEGTCRFVHHKFQEYFAAEHLDRMLRTGLVTHPEIPGICRNIWWDEVTAILTGICSAPEFLVSALLDSRDPVPAAGGPQRKFLLVGRCVQFMPQSERREVLLQRVLDEVRGALRSRQFGSRVDCLRGLAQMDHRDAVAMLASALRDGSLVIRELAFYGLSRTITGRKYLNQHLFRIARDAFFLASFGSRAGRYVGDAQAASFGSIWSRLIITLHASVASISRFGAGWLCVATGAALIGLGRASAYSIGLLGLRTCLDLLSAMRGRGLRAWKLVRKDAVVRAPFLVAVAVAELAGSFSPPIASSLTVLVALAAILVAQIHLVLRSWSQQGRNWRDVLKRMNETMTDGSSDDNVALAALHTGLMTPEEFVSDRASSIETLASLRQRLGSLNLGGRELEIFEAIENAERKILQQTTSPIISEVNPSIEAEGFTRGDPQRKEPEQPEYDVFIAYNSRDVEAARILAEDLSARGLRVWIDLTELRPGTLHTDEIAAVLERCSAIAVLVGRHGVGQWQQLELSRAISQFVARRAPVIPVILDGIAPSALPSFLSEFKAVVVKNRARAIQDIQFGVTGRR